MHRYPDKFKTIFFSNRNFVYTWTGEFLAQAALNIVLVIISVLSHEGVLSNSTKDSALSIAVILNLATIPGLFLAPVAGVIADWFPKKKIVLVVAALRFLILFSFFLVSGWDNIWLSYGVVLLLSIVLQFNMPAEGGIIPLLVKKENIMFANSMFYLDIYGTLAISTLASGIFLSLIGPRGVFFTSSLFFLLEMFFISKVKLPEDKGHREPLSKLFDFLRSLIKDVIAGFHYVFKSTGLMFSLTHLFLLQIVGISLLTLVFRIGSEIFGVSPRTAGFVILSPMVFGVGLGFLLMNTIWRKKSRISLISNGALFGFFSFALMFIIAYLDGKLGVPLYGKVIAGVSLFSIGYAAPFLLIPGQTLIHENTLPEFRGRVMGIWSALTSSLASVFALFIGAMADRIGNISIPVLIMAILSIIYFGITLLISRKLKI